MKLRNFLGGLVAAISLLSMPAGAWWAGGHQAVGLIALHRLKPATRAKLLAILAHHPDGGEYSSQFNKACVWPDDIRKKPGDHPTWHYRDKPFFDGVPDHPVGHGGEDALFAYRRNREILNDPQASASDKAIALSWLGHLVGDIHQPLHASTRCDVVHPDGDAGGNLFPVQLEGIVPGNLHKLWDSVGTELSPDPNPAQLQAFVEKLEMHYPRTFFLAQVDDRKPSHWLDESYQLAVFHAYAGIHPNDSPTSQYISDARMICEQRIALAGYRLADLLEDSL